MVAYTNERRNWKYLGEGYLSDFLAHLFNVIEGIEKQKEYEVIPQDLIIKMNDKYYRIIKAGQVKKEDEPTKNLLKYIQKEKIEILCNLISLEIVDGSFPKKAAILLAVLPCNNSCSIYVRSDRVRWCPFPFIFLLIRDSFLRGQITKNIIKRRMNLCKTSF